MTDAPFDDFLRDYIAAHYQHHLDMETAMWWNEKFIGVPYGPALCETRPSQLRGIMSVVDQGNRAERRAAKKGKR